MAATVIADAGFLAALLRGRDTHHLWAVELAEHLPPPWHTCEAALSEAFYILAPAAAPALIALLDRRALLVSFELNQHLEPVLALMRKYANVPISVADASIIRMSEIMAEPIVLTTDADFRVYRRHGRQVVPCAMPS
jgi:predicted nucleic acid-binding protein